jgi:hypothetical protein
MTESRALLYVHMTPSPAAEDDLNAWYDQHALARLALPGVNSAARYKNVGPGGAPYLAVYDLDDADTLDAQAYRDLRAREIPKDEDLMGRLTLLDRRVYRALDVGRPWTAPWTDHAPFIVSMTMDPRPDMVDDWHNWYLEEHIPMLMKIDGWRRIRRYEQVESTRPSLLAVHELESLDVFGTQAFKDAVGTPWRNRVFGYVSRRERLTFQLLRGY